MFNKLNRKIYFRLYGIASVLVLNGLLSAGASAAPEEIQVYLDDFTEAGKIGLDLHSNYVVSGQQPTRHQLRLTPELSYGINDHWETATYFLTVKSPSGSLDTNGVKVRARWRPNAPSPASPFYWAVNFEVGRLAKAIYQDQTSGEIKLIGVWKTDPWTLGVNVNLDRALKFNPTEAATSEIDTKIAYQVREGLQLGIENYAFLGPLQNSQNQSQSSVSNYLVADFGSGKWDFNVGIGHVSGLSTDKTVLKAIIGFPF